MKDCEKCICANCINKMWDGIINDCFHCEYCTDGDFKLTKCRNEKIREEYHSITD